MSHVTTCPECGKCYEETSEEWANSPSRRCGQCTLAAAKQSGTYVACGPRETCPDGSAHDYSDGAEIENGWTAVCAKCGHRAIDDAWWY